jgi:outer membrane protein
LQITNDEEFDVAIPTTTEEMALQEIPGVNNVYAAALDLRPEIKNSKLAIESSDLSIKIAKAQNLPTIGVSASAGTNTTSMSSSAWGSQLKTNFDLGAGVTVSIPIFDNRSRKTAVNKAIIQKQSYMLDQNIIELMTGKTNLITAQQNELQSKYLTILNIDLLNFYKTGELK